MLTLYRLASTPIQRHNKVKGTAHPFDPCYADYFEKRRCFAWRTRERKPVQATGPTIRNLEKIEPLVVKSCRRAPITWSVGLVRLEPE